MAATLFITYDRYISGGDYVATLFPHDYSLDYSYLVGSSRSYIHPSRKSAEKLKLHPFGGLWTLSDCLHDVGAGWEVVLKGWFSGSPHVREDPPAESATEPEEPRRRAPPVGEGIQVRARNPERVLVKEDDLVVVLWLRLVRHTSEARVGGGLRLD